MGAHWENPTFYVTPLSPKEKKPDPVGGCQCWLVVEIKWLSIKVQGIVTENQPKGCE